MSWYERLKGRADHPSERKPRETIIYGLYDPRASLIKYIGQTRNLEKRVKEHRSRGKYLIRYPQKGKTPLDEWLYEFAVENRGPHARELARVSCDECIGPNCFSVCTKATNKERELIVENNANSHSRLLNSKLVV